MFLLRFHLDSQLPRIAFAIITIHLRYESSSCICTYFKVSSVIFYSISSCIQVVWTMLSASNVNKKQWEWQCSFDRNFARILGRFDANLVEIQKNVHGQCPRTVSGFLDGAKKLDQKVIEINFMNATEYW